MAIFNNLCASNPLTPTQLLAADAASTLRPCTSYTVAFTGGDSQTHTVRFSGSQSGKSPGYGELLHNNGETYPCMFLPQAAGGIYGLDTVEVYNLRDHRGNEFTSSPSYVTALALNPVWYFWWGNDKVEGNIVVNSYIHSDTGEFSPHADSYFSGNRFEGGSQFNVSLTPYTAPDPVSGLNAAVQVGGCNFYSVEMALLHSATYDPTDAQGSKVLTSLTFYNSTISFECCQQVQLSSTVGYNTNLSSVNSGLSFSSNDLGLATNLTVSGNDDPDDYVTFGSLQSSQCSIVVTLTPSEQTPNYSECRIKGVTVDLDPTNHSGLQLEMREESGRSVFRSNLTVTKDVAVAAEFASSNIIMDTKRDAYAGEVILNGIKSAVGTPTAVITITKAVQPAVGTHHGLRLTAGVNSGGTVNGYLRITPLGANASPLTAHRVIGGGGAGTIISKLGEAGSCQHLLLRSDLSLPIWVLERNELYV